MKAIRIHAHGGPEQLRIDELEMPRPEAHQVLVQIKSAALNRLDIWVRNGIPGIHPPPLVLGSDGAGVVVETGARVTQYKVGDTVVAQPGYGCGLCTECLTGREQYCARYGIVGEHYDGVQAEYVAFDEDKVIRHPSQITSEEAAAIPLVGITAWEMVVNKGAVKQGDMVLVIAASSGVGSAAVQIAKAFGAQVIATAGTQKLAKARALGADHVVDHYKQDVAKEVKKLTGGRGVDAVIDSGGVATWQAALRSLAKGGKLVLCGATTGPEVQLDLRFLFIRQQSIVGSTMGSRGDMFHVMKLAESRKLRGIVDRVFHFTEVAKAHEYLESGQHFGKVLLRFAE